MLQILDKSVFYQYKEQLFILVEKLVGIVYHLRWYGL